MVQLFANRAGGALHRSEVPDPRILGEFAFQLDHDLVVVAVKRLAPATEGGHVGRGEAEAVALDGDSAGDWHPAIVP